jgi:hypothetical protein
MFRLSTILTKNFNLKIEYMKKHLSLNVEAKVYNEIKNAFPAGQVSNYVNDILKEHLKKMKKEKLIADYKSTARSKAMREEDKI